MTMQEYISQKFQSFGITISEADALDMCLNAKITSIEEEVSANNIDRIQVGIAHFIPTLLLRATSISESGFSMSWNIEGIKAYYSYLCKRYGLTDELNTDKPKVKFL